MSSRARCGGAAEVLEISRTTGAERRGLLARRRPRSWRAPPRGSVRPCSVRTRRPIRHGSRAPEHSSGLWKWSRRSYKWNRGRRAGVISVLDRTGIVVFLALCLRPSPLHLSRQTRPAPRPGAGRRSYGATRAHTRHRGFSSRLRTSWLLRWCLTGCRATPRDVSQTARCVPRRSDTSMDR